MEVSLPDAPVALAPGVPTRVPLRVRNPFAQAVTLRVSVARGRAREWATVEPPEFPLGPGESAEVAVILCTPPDQPVSSSMVPFTVHVAEAGGGEPAGFATALLTVAIPVPVTGRLIARPEPHAYDLRLANDTPTPARLRVAATLEPPSGTAEATPEALQLDPGASVTVSVRARPTRPLSGTARAFTLVVEVRDAVDASLAPYLTEVAHGTRRARVSSRVATVIAVLLALGATAVIALTGDHVSLPGR